LEQPRSIYINADRSYNQGVIIVYIHTRIYIQYVILQYMHQNGKNVTTSTRYLLQVPGTKLHLTYPVLVFTFHR